MCVAKPVAVELRCHATALILVIGKAQFRRAMLSCDSSCFTFLLHKDFVFSDSVKTENSTCSRAFAVGI